MSRWDPVIRTSSLLQECTSPCCNATVCTLKPDAVCAHGLCCEGCQVSPPGPEVVHRLEGFATLTPGEQYGETPSRPPLLQELQLLVTQVRIVAACFYGRPSAERKARLYAKSALNYL